MIAAAVWATAAHAADTERPNIIVILADDLGLGDLGCYGGDVAATPHLDALASRGIRFTQYYSASPICSPSRAGLITGMAPARWNLTSYLQTRQGNRGCEQADFLDPEAPSLPRALKQAGYGTAHIGKWHLGGGRDVTDAPKFAAYGYDEHVGTYESPEPHPDITASNWIWSDKDKVKRWDRTRFFVDKTLDFLRRHPDQPCFVNLWLDDPHTPWVPSEMAEKRQSLGNLRAVLTELDRQVGRLLDELRRMGVEQNTLVIFTSDNGPLPTFERRRTAEMRGSKLSLYEGGIRVPIVAYWPGHIPAGKVDETTVLSALDLFPTLVSIAGAEMPERVRFDGEDMRQALLGTPRERKTALYWEYGRNAESFGYPKRPQDRSPNVAVRERNWKLLVNADRSGVELYDLGGDPQESKNMAAANAGAANRLTKQALDWRKSLPRYDRRKR